MNIRDPVTLVRASYQAYVDKDRPALEALLAPDFHFTSPVDNMLDRATYFDRCWPNSTELKGFEFVHIVPNGMCVFVTYVGETKSGKRFRNTEILTVRAGKIANVEVYFGWNVPHPAMEGTFINSHVRSES